MAQKKITKPKEVLAAMEAHNKKSGPRAIMQQIPIVKEGKGAMFLRMPLASGKTKEGEKFEVTMNANGAAIHFDIKGQFYTMMLSHITEAFIRASGREP